MKRVAFCPKCAEKSRFLGEVSYFPGEVVIMFNCDNNKCKMGQFSVSPISHR